MESCGHDIYGKPFFRADFCILTFNEHLGNTKEDLQSLHSLRSKPAWTGDQTTKKEFFIEREPVIGHAYLLISAYEVHFSGHTAWINNTVLPFYEIPPCKGQWNTSIAPIGIALKGNSMNTIQIRRDPSKEDNFIIGNVIVHWREILRAPTNAFER